MKQYLIYLWLLLLLLTQSVFAIRSPARQNVASLGMGGAYTAYPFDAASFLENPAFLNQTTLRVDVFNMTISTNPQTYSAINFLKQNHPTLLNIKSISNQDANRLLGDIDAFDDRYIGITVNPQTAINYRRFGAAGYIDFAPAFRLDKGIYEPKLFARGYLDAVVAAGFGTRVRLPNKKIAHLGAAIKLIQRHEASPLKVSASRFTELQQIVSELIDTLRTPQTGMAVDFGTLYPLKDHLDVGLAVRNIGKIQGRWLPMYVNTGVAHTFQSPVRIPFLHHIVFAADYRDVFNADGVAVFNKTHLGLEAVWPYLRLRLGLHQGYFSTGFGVSYGSFHLNYAYYGRELGQAPGWDSSFNHAVQIRVGL